MNPSDYAGLQDLNPTCNSWHNPWVTDFEKSQVKAKDPVSWLHSKALRFQKAWPDFQLRKCRSTSWLSICSYGDDPFIRLQIAWNVERPTRNGSVLEQQLQSSRRRRWLVHVGSMAVGASPSHRCCCTSEDPMLLRRLQRSLDNNGEMAIAFNATTPELGWWMPGWKLGCLSSRIRRSKKVQKLSLPSGRT